ncbi:MAG: PD-(D/E)XK nuclease family protein, partial [Deltaproteobacteria bacterium]|nr:PD-(D/E)XK nuclease family protein [Deltaproteobacteria bacterium]
SRPFSAPASADAHEAIRESLAAQAHGGEGEEDGWPIRRRGPAADSARRAAMAAGTAVHRVLEMLDLEGDAAAHLRSLMAQLPAIVAAVASPDIRDAAIGRARALLDSLAAGPLLERLRAVGPHILSRETPLLLPPAGETGAVGFRAGTVDLLYCDPESKEIVVADYKTDTGLDRAALAARAEAYAGQGQVYVEGVSQALGLAQEPRFELWFIDAGEIVTVPPAASSAGEG